MAVKNVFDLQAGDVFAAGDDHVLAAVSNLDVAVRVNHRQVAGMEPACGKGFLRGLRVFQVALHHQVAAKEYFAQALSVSRYLFQGDRVEHGNGLLQGVGHTLSGVQGGAFADWQPSPFGLLGAYRSRAIHLGEAVHMRDVDTDALAALDDGRRRRRPCDQASHRVVDARAQRFGRVDQQAVDDGRAAQVADPVLADQRKNQRRVDPAQTHAHTGLQRQSPRKAPAVAVEHGQRPQVDRVLRQGPGDDVGDRIEIGAPVVRDHPLGIAGGARGVVQRNRVPFVAGQAPVELRITLGQKCLVAKLANQVASHMHRVVHINHQGPGAGHQGQRLGNRGGELPVGDQHPCLTVFQHKSNRGCIQPGVQRVQHGAQHRHTKVGLEHWRRVGQHGGHGVAHANTALRQGAGKLPAALVSLGPGVAAFSMQHRWALRIDAGRAGQKAQGRQGCVVGLIAPQCLVVDVAGHGCVSWVCSVAGPLRPAG